MELYYKDLISEDASLEKLVDDLMLLVQGANDFAEEAGLGRGVMPAEEIATKLERLRAGCRRLKEQAMAGAAAADQTMRRYPYSSLALAFGLGVLTGVLFRRR